MVTMSRKITEINSFLRVVHGDASVLCPQPEYQPSFPGSGNRTSPWRSCDPKGGTGPVSAPPRASLPSPGPAFGRKGSKAGMEQGAERDLRSRGGLETRGTGWRRGKTPGAEGVTGGCGEPGRAGESWREAGGGPGSRGRGRRGRRSAGAGAAAVALPRRSAPLGSAPLLSSLRRAAPPRRLRLRRQPQPQPQPPPPARPRSLRLRSLRSSTEAPPRPPPPPHDAGAPRALPARPAAAGQPRGSAPR